MEKGTTRAAVALVLFAALGGAAAGEAQDARQGETSKLRYVRAGEGAVARNLPDAQGVAVLEVPEGTVLAVHDQRGPWLETEAPGGFRVWVFGEYLRASPEAGTLQVTGSEVRMRPLASSGPESLPLKPSLGVGDRVRLIRRNDPSLSMEKDWVQVWSPPGARAWVHQDQTEPLAEGESGAALWAAAVAEVEARPRGQASEAVAPDAAGAQQTSDALAAADAALEEERKKEQAGGAPDYASVRAAYEEVLAVNPTGSSAELARNRLELVRTYSEAYDLKTELERKRASLEESLRRREEEMKRAGERDVFDGRFDARGWLERSQRPEETDPRWVLRWSGEPVAELVSRTGRYDLSIFEGYELGIRGREIRAARPQSSGTPPSPAQIDISRIEVISGRPRR